jgi:hypothetical protein
MKRKQYNRLSARVPSFTVSRIQEKRRVVG